MLAGRTASITGLLSLTLAAGAISPAQPDALSERRATIRSPISRRSVAAHGDSQRRCRCRIRRRRIRFASSSTSPRPTAAASPSLRPAWRVAASSGEWFKRMAGIEMTHVPYRGAGPAMNDLLPGRVSAMFSNLPGVIPQILGKPVRGLALTSARRVAAAPTSRRSARRCRATRSAWWGVLAPPRHRPPSAGRR